MYNQLFASRISAILVVFSLSITSIFLSSCGGGGGGSSGPTVSVEDNQVTEGDLGNTINLDFTVRLSTAQTSDVTVNFATSNGTATTADSDYVSNSGSVTIPAGDTTTTVSVVITGDDTVEPNETIILTLSSPTIVSLGTATATGTIISDDHANPKGFYTGSATLNDPTSPGNSINPSDMVALISGNRLMLGSISGKVFYDGTMVINGSDFTANVTLYYNMDADQSTGTLIPTPTTVTRTITGTIDETVGITGTITGSDVGSGTFNVNYNNTQNAIAANLLNIDEDWSGYLNGKVDMDWRMIIASNGDISNPTFNVPVSGVFKGCRIDEVTGGETISAIPGESLFSISIEFFGTCSEYYPIPVFTGFAITTNNSHDTLLIMFSNGVISGMGELTITPQP